MPAEVANGVADVSQQLFETTGATGVAHLLLELLDSAESQQCRTPGLDRVSSFPNPMRHFLLHMEAQLSVEFPFGASLEGQSPEAFAPIAQQAHPSAARRNASTPSIAPEARRHAVISWSS